MTEFYDKDFFMPLKFMALIMEIYLYYHIPEVKLYCHAMPKSRFRKCSFLITPLPLWEGTEGRGNLLGHFHPHLSLSHQGRGEFKEFLSLF